MKKKLYLNRTIKLISLFLAVAVCSYLLQTFLLCHSDSNRERIKAFYLEKEDTLDVVFIGASEVYCDFASSYAYGKYGFTSYPYVSQGMPITLYTTAVKEVLRKQHPKLFVVEINAALYGSEHMVNESYYKYYLDSMPLNKNKIDFIENNITENKIEYYLPLIKYHNNWSKFPKDLNWSFAVVLDYFRGYNLLKGVKNNTVTSDLKKEELYNYSKKEKNRCLDLEPSCYQGFIEFLDFCKSENLNVVFTRFPHPIIKNGLNRSRRANEIGKILKEYGYDYLNFDYMLDELGLDPVNDYYNAEHMNIFGQKKFTEYFSEYLMEHYSITESELDEKTKERWDKCAEEYEIYEQLNLDAFENGEDVTLGGDFKTFIRKLKKK